MNVFILATWLTLGCSIQQYGGGSTGAVEAASQTVEPVDFSSIENQLEGMIANETENLDRRDRLEAAWELCQKAKTVRPSSQQIIVRYLERVARIEARWSDADTDAIANPDEQSFVPIASIVAEQIEPPTVAETVNESPQRLTIVPPDRGAAAVMDAARAHLAAGALEQALNQLKVCEGQACGAATVTLTNEVRDRLVYRDREAAGQRFNAAKLVSDRSQRVREMKAVEASLAALAVQYPRSRYSGGVKESLDTVRAVLAEEKKGGAK